MRRINLGHGADYMEGWINIDFNKKVKADIYRDLEKGLPFDDNSVDEVFARHFVEHIADDVFLMNEIWRVCKNGAKVSLTFPTAHSTAMCDWGHKSFWNARKIHYLNQDNRASYTGLDCNFRLVHELIKQEIDADILEVELEVVK